MYINPKISMWFCIVSAVISGLIACGAQFTDIFGAEHAKMILGILGIENTIINAVNAVLHAIPATATPSPGAAGMFPLGPSITPKP